MLLKPNRTKFRKFHKRFKKSKLFSLRKVSINISAVSLQAKTSALVTAQQLEAARKVIRRYIRRFNNILRIPTIPYTNITKKPVEVRMGKGKGNVSDWVIPVQHGKILFEILDNTLTRLKKSIYLKALLAASKKLSVKCVVVLY